MLNPAQFAHVIDTCIAEFARCRGQWQVGRIADAILARLAPEDRRGIDRELLGLIVAARASFRRRSTAAASAAA